MVQFEWAPTGGGGPVGVYEAPDKGVQTQPTTYRYVEPWRWTRYGGRDQYIGVCGKCMSVILPVPIHRSRRATHGKDMFVHRHPLTFVILYESNSGNRDFGLQDAELISPEITKDIRDIVRRTWIDSRASIEEVVDELRKYLLARWLAKVLGGGEG